MSTAAQEAIERAKAIAAKLKQTTDGIAGTATNASSTSSPSGKRRRWGLAPGDPDPSSDSKKAKVEGDGKPGELESKRMWITTSAYRPATHFVNFMKDELELVAQKLGINKDNGEKAIATLEGRGSGGKPPMPGMPLEPLHIFLQASSKSLLTRIEMFCDDLLQRAEEATVHPDLISAAAAEEARNGESNEERKKTVASTSLALATIQDPSTLHSSNASYKPASVAQLIGQVNNGGAEGGAWYEENVPCPVGVVGFVIGKGGENILSMQARTGAKVQVQREADSSSSTTHKNIQVGAATREALEECKKLIRKIIEEKSRILMGPGARGSSFKDSWEEAKNMGHAHVTLPVPDDEVGLVIGKGGATIRSLQERSGANIQVPSAQESKDGKRTIHITHPTKDGAEEARKMITNILEVNAANNAARKGTSVGNSEPQVSVTMMIPDGDVGLVIGKQGVVIKYLQESNRVRIQIPTECLPGQDQRMATITGPTAGCQQAQALIAQICADQSSAGVMSQASPTAGGGGAAGSYGNFYSADGARRQARSQPQEGQEGYSAEWAAYHAAQAAAAAAASKNPQGTTMNNYQQGQQYAGYGYQQNGYSQHQQQQGLGARSGPDNNAPLTNGAGQTNHIPQSTAAGGNGSVQPSGAGSTPARDAYYEQFFRYAYYYGEQAARQHYGAWSPPEGTPNPYGQNPAGVSAPPATSQSPAAQHGSQSTASTAAPQGVSNSASMPVGRETSVRKVSNLPAWMNKKTA